jgi:hypothetical protein
MREAIAITCFIIGIVSLLICLAIIGAQPLTISMLPADQIAYQSSKGMFQFIMAGLGVVDSPEWRKVAIYAGISGIVFLLAGCFFQTPKNGTA